MGNWGKPFTLIGAVLLILGIVFLTMGSSILGIIGSIFASFGALFIFFGLPRLVKGANPKIYGKIMRPSARARSAWIWALYLFNFAPLIIPTTLVLDVLDMKNMPPFPIAILASGFPWYPHSDYGWLLPVVISFFVLWIIFGILSGKYPGFVAVFFNTILAICFTFWFNFGVYMFIWAFYENTSLLTYPATLDANFYEMFARMLPFYANADMRVWSFVIVRLPLALSILLFGFFMLLRMFRQLAETYANIETKTPKMKSAVTFGVLLSYLATLAPLYFSIVFAIDNHPMVVPLMNFAVLIFVVIIVIKAVTSMLTSLRELSRQKIGEGSGKNLNFGFTTAIFIAILIISWMPIFLPLVDNGMNTKNHSAYNDDWNGWSKFRGELENNNYTTYALQSSLSAISRLDQSKQVILMIQGPNKFYNPTAEIPFFLQAFNTNFSMFICEDHGQGFTLLFEMFVASLGKTPFTIIPQGTLMDNATGSYYKKPEFPIISDFGPNSENFTKGGVNQVVLSHATSFLGTIDLLGFNVNLLEHLGWNVIGQTGATYSYLDINGDRMWDQYNDAFKLPSSITGVLEQQDDAVLSTLGGFLELGIPLKGTQVCFATKEIGYEQPTPSGNGTFSSRVFVGTDASWLNNELAFLKDPSNPTENLFDNLVFAKNIVEWLSCGRQPEDVIIVFDESHIRPESGMMDFSSAGSFGFLHGYVNWLSTNPLMSFLYPLMALRTLSNWIPKEQSKKKVQLSELIEAEKKKELLQFRTSSFFAKKINWYRVHKKYKQALQLLNRRIERKLHKMVGEGAQMTVDNIVNAIVSSKGAYISKENLKRIRDFFTRMQNLKNNSDVIRDEEDFQEMFLEMQWISDNI